MAKCFKCEKNIGCAVITDKDDDLWEMPADAVHFQGGNNFGSAIYDSMVDGVTVEVLICDECLTSNKDKLREIKVK